MEAVLEIFASIDDPRDHTAQDELPPLLFIALAASLCGAKSCVDIARWMASAFAGATNAAGLACRL